MDAMTIIETVLPYLYGLVAVAGAFALFAIGRLAIILANEARTVLGGVTPILDNVNPILEKADVTMDGVNAEILRVDGILANVEQITASAATTTASVEQITNAPLNLASTLAEKLRVGIEAFSSGFKEKKDAARASITEVYDEVAEAVVPDAKERYVEVPLDDDVVTSVAAVPDPVTEPVGVDGALHGELDELLDEEEYV